MTDFTEENGGTRLIPGSHHFDDKLQFTEADTEAAEMAKGSVLVYNGACTTAAARTNRRAFGIGMNITYCVGGCARRRTSTSPLPPTSRGRCRSTSSG